MTIELIKCPHCGYKYKTDVEKVVKDGETIVVRLDFSEVKKIFRRKTAENLFIDLKCPNCKKDFECEVKT